MELPPAATSGVPTGGPIAPATQFASSWIATDTVLAIRSHQRESRRAGSDSVLCPFDGVLLHTKYLPDHRQRGSAATASLRDQLAVLSLHHFIRRRSPNPSTKQLFPSLTFGLAFRPPANQHFYGATGQVVYERQSCRVRLDREPAMRCLVEDQIAVGSQHAEYAADHLTPLGRQQVFINGVQKHKVERAAHVDPAVRSDHRKFGVHAMVLRPHPCDRHAIHREIHADYLGLRKEMRQRHC